MTAHPQIDSTDALRILDETLAKLQTDRQGHVILQQCLTTLQTAVSNVAKLTEENEQMQAQVAALQAELKNIDGGPQS